MKFNKKDLFKIFFKNGTTVDGYILKWKKKKAVIQTNGGARLLVFHPMDSIMMILEISTPEEQPEEQLVEEPINTYSPPIILKIGMVLQFRDQSQWQVIDSIHEYVTLQNVKTGEEICPNAIEITVSKGWNVIQYPVETISSYKEEEMDMSYQPDHSLKAKKLVDLHLTKKKIELEAIANQVNSFTPNNTASKVRVYELPNFSKSIPPQHTSSQTS